MYFCNIPVFMSTEKKNRKNIINTLENNLFIGQNLVKVVQKEVLERPEKKIF